MTARSDILDAVKSLTARGMAPFSPLDVLVELRGRGTAYRESTLRTHITHWMCVDSEGHRWPDLERTRRGQYRLHGADDNVADQAQPHGCHERREEQPTPAEAAAPLATDGSWYWEGNVQAAVVAHLSGQGWSIVRVADTSSRERGADIVARRGQQRLVVEVKGYPSSVYARGERSGQPKPTQPATQARHWFAEALLSAMLVAGQGEEATIVVALPDFPTYRALAERTNEPLRRVGLSVWLVREDGEVHPGVGSMGL